MRRRVVYLTGTRADFGLMQATLHAIASRPGLQLDLVVTGMHLSRRYGHTVDDVYASGLPIYDRILVDVDDDGGTVMAQAAAGVAAGMAIYFASRKPDACLLLGDRWEMLAAAMSATLSGVPIFHLCGGERSGSVDDAMRHAVSKLAHVHGAATPGARDRLLALGEEPWRVHVVGTPGLVGLEALVQFDRHSLARQHGLDPEAPIAMVLFHPVVQESQGAGAQMQAVLAAVRQQGLQAICLMPNADAGNSAIRQAIESAAANDGNLRTVVHLPRPEYVSWMAAADVLVGNSSSGIIEAATLGTPVVNVGDRQADRERNSNTLDCPPQTDAISAALASVRGYVRNRRSNVYGDGKTDARVADLLEEAPLDQRLLSKRLTY